ncbi:MAG TPA: kynureninase [Usitatibacteraceae bacterium]|nr:kynureninase [Usitatibacteraceae bacterium]
MTFQQPTQRGECERMDQLDPLAEFRDRFSLPDGVIYLDGNSLGAMPAGAAQSIGEVVSAQWGSGLIRSWNRAGWVHWPRELGAGIARLVGAQDDEVIVADSTSVNLFKLAAGALALAQQRSPGRRVILSEEGNFPTDLYVAQGIAKTAAGGCEVRLVGEGKLAEAFRDDVALALVTQVDYRSGRLHDMAQLNARARQAGVQIVWDLSHSAGALPLHLGRDGAQLAVGCGYKYLNGGPGAPAFAYVAKPLQADFPMPLAGWFGHSNPFAFAQQFLPAAGIERFQCGTPPILSLAGLRCGLATFDGVDLQLVRAKSLALSALFLHLVEAQCAGMGFRCISPRDPDARGSQLSFAHPHAWPIMQAIIDRGVIGDFRQPDLLRFGFTPLYQRYTDIWDAVAILREVMLSSAWDDARYRARNIVT